MKRFIALSVAVIFCSAVFPQMPSANVLTGGAEQNILFAGIKNPVIVHVPDVRDDDIQLRSNDAYVVKENGSWYISPKDNKNEWLEVEVLIKKGSTYVPAGKKRFFVQHGQPEQLACIVTPAHTYRNGDRIPLTELLDDSTRVQVLFNEWIDYPESEMELSRFMVRCQATITRCTGQTLSVAVKDSIRAAFDRGAEELPMHITPTIEKKTAHSAASKVLKSSKFVISQ